MNAFLRAAESRALAEREARLVFTPGCRLAGGHLDTKGPGGDMRSPKAKAEREETLRKRAERVTAMRAQGLKWTEIARRLALSPRAVRHAVQRTEWKSMSMPPAHVRIKGALRNEPMPDAYDIDGPENEGDQ